MSALLPPLQLKPYTHDGRPGRRNYLYLTFVMAMTDFKIKYDNSVLGYFWSLLKPLMMFGTLYLVFSGFHAMAQNRAVLPTLSLAWYHHVELPLGGYADEHVVARTQGDDPQEDLLPALDTWLSLRH